MPKVNLTVEEKRIANYEKEFRKQDRMLRAIIHEKVYRKVSYEEFATKAGVSKSTVQKFVNAPEKMSLPLLRKCCIAALPRRSIKKCCCILFVFVGHLL